MTLLPFPLFIILFVAIGFIWLHYNKKSLKAKSIIKHTLPSDYFVGLQYLINEQPDQAVDTFIKLLEVTPDTFETHLILGNLFRRRGEVDRAIRLHQNLLARPQLHKEQRLQALSELAQDYFRAGVWDRAERLFLELATLGNPVNSWESLLNIYEQEKDWLNAIAIAEKLVEHNKMMNSCIAHYYCELAEICYEKKQLEQTKQYLKKGLMADYRCVRVYLLRAKIEMQQNDFKAAIRTFHQVKQYDSEFIAEIIVPVTYCYEALGLENELLDFLRKCLKEHPRSAVALLLPAYLKRADTTSLDVISHHMQQYPSLRALQQLIGYYRKNTFDDERLQLLEQLIAALLIKKPLYRCAQCGFSVKSLYWQCPQCRNWNSVKPIYGD